MPPMYQYKCDVCGQSVDVLRKHDDQYPPLDTESQPCADGAGATQDAVGVHLWRKVITAPSVAKGPGWGPGKGHW